MRSSARSSSSGSSSGGGYTRPVLTVTGGGGTALGNTRVMQLGVGQPVVSNPSAGARASFGLFSTWSVP